MADFDTNVTETTETVETIETEEATETAELAKLKAEIARQKAALDKATKEAGDYKKQLRAKQSAEEVAAEEKRIADEERDRKLAEYEKRFTVAETSKKIFSFVQDEGAANAVAESLYGAEDVDAAIDAFNKAWIAREKKLRIEYGKIPAPGVGSADGMTITKDQLNAMGYSERAKFANDHPDEYNKLMGR